MSARKSLKNRVRRQVLGVTLALATLACAPVVAQGFPDQPVRMTVGFPPGGGTDIVARIFAEQLSTLWKQPVVVENKAGAGGVIATEAVSRAAPDGLTLFMATMGNLSVNQHLYPMKADPEKDLLPVGQAVAVHFVMVAHPSLPVNNVQDLIEYAKKNPGQVHYSSSGIGGAPHLAGELFNARTGAQLVHVPYRGSGPSMTDLIGGQVSLTFDSLVQVLPHIKAGKLKPLAVLGSKRSPLLPDVPTMTEAGVKDYDVTNWFGVVVPAGTPEDRIKKLNADLVNVQQNPEVRNQLQQMGADIAPTTPEEFGALIKNESAMWAQVIKDAGIKAQ